MGYVQPAYGAFRMKAPFACMFRVGVKHRASPIIYYKGEELMVIFEGVHSKASKHVEGNTIDYF